MSAAVSEPLTRWFEPRLLAVGMVGFCAFLDLHCAQPLLQLFTEVFAVSPVQASLTVSVTPLAVALAAPFVGLVADRRSRKGFIIFSLLLLAVPTFLAATSGGLTSLVVWRFLQGFVMPGAFAVILAYISEEWGGGNLGRAMSANIAGNVLGGFSGRFIAGWMADHFGWRSAFLILGALTILGATVVWLWLPPSRQYERRTVNAPPIFTTLGTLLRNRNLLAVCAVGFSVLFCLTGTFTYVNFYLGNAPFGLGPGALGSIFAVYLIGVIVTPIAGRHLDRIGHRRALALALTCAASGLLLTLIPRLPIVILGLTICSTGTFICQSASTTALGVATNRDRSAAAGLYLTFYYTGGSLGALLPGLAWSHGGWPMCVAALALVQLGTVGFALATWPSRLGAAKVVSPALG
jgi:YNFM family putative membrane transporter